MIAGDQFRVKEPQLRRCGVRGLISGHLRTVV